MSTTKNRRVCKIKGGKLYCKDKNGKWKQVGKDEVKIKSTKPFQVRNGFKRVRSNVC